MNKPIIWLFGRPCSGKTTIGKAIQALDQENNTILLDGDQLRGGMNNDLGFSRSDRTENIRRTAELALVLAMQEFRVVVALVTPLAEHRQVARAIIDDYTPIHFYEVVASLPDLIERDVKGHYKMAAAGEITNFTGLDGEYDEAVTGETRILTRMRTPVQCANMIRALLVP